MEMIMPALVAYILFALIIVLVPGDWGDMLVAIAAASFVFFLYILWTFMA